MMGPGDGPSSSSSSLSSMMGHEEVGLAVAETSMEEMMMWSWLSSWEEEMEVAAPPEFMMDGGGDFWEEYEATRTMGRSE
ncbi:hypothetical protein QJS10_CPA16g01628 [Acorus calamus]|uniref:Uncharacterized protein n=1 Tax=Acorus calamus TaxID=4465 RepID=A0AAV9D2Z2_ACOCL|nr:hypothetical protein QJS10_CPA16g01628 [Acorus calamus]